MVVVQGEILKQSPQQALTPGSLLAHHLPLIAYLLNEGTHISSTLFFMPNQTSSLFFSSFFFINTMLYMLDLLIFKLISRSIFTSQASGAWSFFLSISSSSLSDNTNHFNVLGSGPTSGYSWRYESEDGTEEVMRASSAALENLQLDRKN